MVPFIYFFQGKNVGTFEKDKFPGDFMDGWRKTLNKADVDVVS